jgi:hypothetical protein
MTAKLSGPSQIKNLVPPRSKFTPVEDAALVRLVGANPKPDWRIVSQLLLTRTPRQCRERYNNYLSPDIARAEWTAEEEMLLVEQYRKFGPQWKKMKAFFPNRTCVNIKNQWPKVVARMGLPPDIFDPHPPAEPDPQAAGIAPDLVAAPQ